MKLRRIMAIGGLILIALAYLCTLIFALIDSPHAKSMLMASLFCTIVVPAILYAYQMISQVTKQKNKEPEE